MKYQMPPPYDHTGEIVKINSYLGYAAFLGATSFWIWPSDPHWWGFYGLSILMCCSAFALVVNALRTMGKLKKARARWKAIEALGNAPKNARLATKDTLQDGDMN